MYDTSTYTKLYSAGIWPSWLARVASGPKAQGSILSTSPIFTLPTQALLLGIQRRRGKIFQPGILIREIVFFLSTVSRFLENIT